MKELTNLVKTKWLKFGTEIRQKNSPVGSVNWRKYTENEYKVENRLKFPVSTNILTEYHKEYGNIKFVFELCKKELLGPNTPNEIKYSIKTKIHFLEEKLKPHKSIPTKNLQVKHSDFNLVKNIKSQANKILNNKPDTNTAWRVDFNEVFEKYIQYIFQQVSIEFGAKFYANYRIRNVSTKKFDWELNYLEPDGILRKDNSFVVFIDAKYKSHLLNKHSQSEEMKKNFRQDLHQILGYTSFSNLRSKYGILCYPSSSIERKKIKLYNPLTQNKSIIYLLGIPLDTRLFIETKKFLY